MNALSHHKIQRTNAVPYTRRQSIPLNTFFKCIQHSLTAVICGNFKIKSETRKPIYPTVD